MFKALIAGIRGGVSVLSAVLFVVLIGFSALATEYGHALLTKAENQRVADLAAYSGAVIYNTTSSTSSMTSAVNNVAALNGLSGAATGTLVTSPSGDGNQAVRVVVTTSDPLYLAHVLTSSSSLSVSAVAYAEIVPSNQPACIIALNGGGTGVTVTSASGITANDCTIASNASVTASSASTITTKVVDYNTTFPTATSASQIKPPTGTASVTYNKTLTLDPLASNTGVTGAVSRLSTVSSIVSPSVPSGGSNISFALLSKTGSLPAGCSTTSTASPWTVNCTGSGTFTFATLTVSGSTSVTINTSAGSTYVFSGGISVSSSSSLTLGAGTYEIGAGASSCNGVATGYSICNYSSANMTVAGPSTFILAGGIYNGASSHLTLGSGSSSNSYNIGKAADGNSINGSSSTNVTLGDATGAGDIFQTAGSIVNSSSNTLVLPAAAQHDIHGSISVASASTETFGAGIYTVTGYVSVGGGGGASTLHASGVTLVIGGSTTPSSGTCSGMAFCAASASNITLTAPTSGATQDLAVIGPTSTGNTAGALISSAGSSSVSGAFYIPNGAVSVTSASGLGGGTGQCLELIGSQISVSSASAVGSTCTGLGGSGSSTPRITLVQ